MVCRTATAAVPVVCMIMGTPEGIDVVKGLQQLFEAVMVLGVGVMWHHQCPTGRGAYQRGPTENDNDTMPDLVWMDDIILGSLRAHNHEQPALPYAFRMNPGTPANILFGTRTGNQEDGVIQTPGD
ncbi:hypothetical protein B0H16DRAFT_1452155 [Mycena metata]|uniref:Uncharacterized protein n=1 Tax=Mycena metata TaxID=1033252 RepID=A0AAD7JS32_9AGAR|nr:hypothetical protein B0H16DRAFT_1452155 [Mycena metata]